MRPRLERDWPQGVGICAAGIATGSATFDTAVPSWQDCDTSHRQDLRQTAEGCDRSEEQRPGRRQSDAATREWPSTASTSPSTTGAGARGGPGSHPWSRGLIAWWSGRSTRSRQGPASARRESSRSMRPADSVGWAVGSGWGSPPAGGVPSPCRRTSARESSGLTRDGTSVPATSPGSKFAVNSGSARLAAAAMASFGHSHGPARR